MPNMSFLLRAGKILDPPQATITGTVTQYTGVPLAGVNIVVESKYKGAISDLDGTFLIEANADDVLIFSMIGFKTQIIPIDGRDEISIQMFRESMTQFAELTISNNSAIGNISFGGGISIFNSHPILENVIIAGNSVDWYGGGLYLSESNPNLINVLINGNTAFVNGGGIYFYHFTYLIYTKYASFPKNRFSEKYFMSKIIEFEFTK